MRLSIKYAVLLLSIFIFLLCISDLCINSYLINETHQLSQVGTFYPLKSISLPDQDSLSNEEVIGDILKTIILSKQSSSDIQIDIISIDYDQGLIDIAVTQTHDHINGQSENITSRKTIILEEEL